MTKPLNEMSVSSLLSWIAKIGAAGVVVAAVFAWMQTFSTDDERVLMETHILEEHHEDITEVGVAFAEALAPIQKSLENSEVEDAVSRMTRLMNIRCVSQLEGSEWTLGDILEGVRERYRELEGSPFPYGSCSEGVRVAPGL